MSRPDRSIKDAITGQVLWNPQPPLPEVLAACLDPWKFMSPQEALIACAIKIIFYGGARGGGKSDGGLGKFLQQMTVLGRRAKGLVLRREFKQCKDLIKRSHQIFSKAGATYHKTDHEWTFPNGATFLFGGLDSISDIHKFQGHQYTFIWIEEAGEFPSPEPLDLMFPSLRAPEGGYKVMLFTGNPGGVGQEWVRQRFIDPCKEGMEPFWMQMGEGTYEPAIFIPAKVQDNQILLKNDPHYVQDILNTRDPFKIRAWLHGDWYGHANAKVWEIGLFLRKPVCEKMYRISHHWDTSFKDKAHNDPTACVKIGECTWGHYHVLDVQKMRLKSHEIRDRMIKEYNNDCAKYPTSDVIITVEDKASGQSIAPELQEMGYPVYAMHCGGEPDSLWLPPNKLARGHAGNQILASEEVCLPEQADWIPDHLGELSGFPEMAHDDTADALGQGLIFCTRNPILLNEDAGVWEPQEFAYYHA